MRRRTFLSGLGSAAVGGPLASMNAWAPTPPPTDDPGATLDILRPLGPKALSPFRVGARAQLFADDSLVREMHGVDFTLHPAEKRSQPVMTADQPWEGWRLCLSETSSTILKRSSSKCGISANLERRREGLISHRPNTTNRSTPRALMAPVGRSR